MKPRCDWPGCYAEPTHGSRCEAHKDKPACWLDDVRLNVTANREPQGIRDVHMTDRTKDIGAVAAIVALLAATIAMAGIGLWIAGTP